MNPTTIALATIRAGVALITPALLLGLARSGSEHRRPTPKQGDVRHVIEGDPKLFERGFDDLRRRDL